MAGAEPTTSSPPSHLLSVDPGVHSAWALWARLKSGQWYLERHGRLEGADAGDVFCLLGELKGEWRGVHALVEGQWFDGGKKSSHFRAVEKLIESRCAWQSALTIAGATVEVVPPGKWIPAVSKGAQGKDPDERVLWVCLKLFSVIVTKDEAAAIMLGYWWLRRWRHGVLFGRGGAR